MRITTLFLLALLVGCGEDKDDTGPAPEGDADADSDADSDADADADADSDADADADTDSVGDTGCAADSPVPEDWPETMEGADAEFATGYFIAGLGDVNGDGFDDIMLDGSNRTLIMEGPLCGLEWDHEYEADAFLKIRQRSDAWDHPSAGGSMGDLDGDGLPDVYIGDEGSHQGAESAGEVFLAVAPFSGTVPLYDDAVADIVGTEEFGKLGGSVAGVGDVDGDGLPDVLAGAHGEDDGTGRAWLISGTTTGYHSVADVGVSISGTGEPGNVGYQVEAVGDTDGDGVSDVLIGANWNSEGSDGAVRLFRGPILADLSFDDADVTFFGGEVWGGVTSFSGMDDQDGDGLPDLHLGSVASDSISVFSGTVMGEVELSAARSVLMADGAGGHAASAGDIDGDTEPDFVIGIPSEEWASSSWGEHHFEGALYVFFGTIPEGSIVIADSAMRVGGSDDLSNFGVDLAAVGDTNGDGFEDLLVGASYPSTSPLGLLFLGRSSDPP